MTLRKLGRPVKFTATAYKRDAVAVLGPSAFLWSVGDGFHDLGLLVDGGLTANGWQSLYNASLMDGQGDIVGRGRLTSYPGGDFAFLMSPVPEPSTVILLLGGLLPRLPALRATA